MGEKKEKKSGGIPTKINCLGFVTSAGMRKKKRTGGGLLMIAHVQDHVAAFEKQFMFPTGTTGERVEEFLESSGIPGGIIDKRFSGPKGGDMQIE